MAETLGILFLHHNTSAETRRNLASIRARNGSAVIVTMSAAEPFKNGYTLQTTPDIIPLHSLTRHSLPIGLSALGSCNGKNGVISGGL